MAEKFSKFDVPEKEVRRFRCKRTCYWNGTLFIGEDRIKDRGSKEEPSTVIFEGPTKIPANFQWSNWEEF